MNLLEHRTAGRQVHAAAGNGTGGAGGTSGTPFGLGGWPGLDFLRQLSGAAARDSAATPPLASWMAPTLDVGQIEQRISELKTVQFWLEQNIRAIASAVQALEVQKLTLESLRRMNLDFADMAETLRTAFVPGTEAGPGPESAAPIPSAAAPSHARDEGAQDGGEAAAPGLQDGTPASLPGAAEAMAWWGALGQQFQAIAQQALRGAAAPEEAPPPAQARAPRQPARANKPAAVNKPTATNKPTAASEAPPRQRRAAGPGRAAPTRATPTRAAAARAVPPVPPSAAPSVAAPPEPARPRPGRAAR